MAQRYSQDLIGTTKHPWQGGQNDPGEAPAQAGPAPKTPQDTDPNDPDYEGPEDGPFQCSNCQFYSDPNQCQQPDVVRTQGGKVDPNGCCKFFNSLSANGRQS